MHLFHQVQGAGEALILIPGFASGAWTWYCQTAELAKDFRVVTYDPRGVAKSRIEAPSDAENLSMETFVKDAVQVLDTLKIERAHVLGASFGGFVAQELALRFPERVNKLVLACTTSGGENHVKPDTEVLRSFTPDPNLTVGERIKKFFRPAFTDEFNAEHAAEVEKVCFLRETNEVAEAVYFAQLQVAFSFDTSREIGAVRKETLVLTGDQDRIVPMPNSINLAERMPNATLKIIENGSHMFFIENAAEFNGAVKEFLK